MEERALAIYQRELENKNIKLIYEKNLNDRKFIVEPVSFLNFVLNNLISNVIKFFNRDSNVYLSAKDDEDMIQINILKCMVVN